MRLFACVTAASCAAAVVTATVALAGSVTGSTPSLTAEAAMKQYVTNQVHNYTNFPSLTYKLGHCKRLFVHPWLAWGCDYKLNFSVTHCYTLTIAVKRISGTAYRGTVRRAAPCLS